MGMSEPSRNAARGIPTPGSVAIYAFVGCVIGGLLSLIGAEVAGRGRTAQRILGEPYVFLMKTIPIWVFGPVWGALYGLGRKVHPWGFAIFLFGCVGIIVSGFFLPGLPNPFYFPFSVVPCLLGVWLALYFIRSDRKTWS